MKFRLLPTLVFVSLAMNLFLVGLIAGGWRDILGRNGPPAPAPPAAEAPVQAAPVPGAPATADPDPAAPPARLASPGPDRAVEGVRQAPRPPSPPPALAPPPETPPPGEGPPREPGGNPLMRAARDLPDPERGALMSLLRSESEAVRGELRQARRERAMAWRALSRGEVGQDEAARRLDMARRRELAARGRVENAVADWAVRQSPDIRARVGQALAEDAPPPRRRPVRPPGGGPGWGPGGPGGPPPAGPGREDGS